MMQFSEFFLAKFYKTISAFCVSIMVLSLGAESANLDKTSKTPNVSGDEVSLSSSQSSNLNTQLRLVTLSPNLAELVDSAGAGHNLVAVSAYSDNPPWLQSLPVIADSQGVFIESLLAIKPDKIIAQRQIVPPHTQQKLKELGLDVIELSMSSVSEMSDAIVFLSQFAQDKSIGDETIAEINHHLNAIQTAFANNKRQYQVFIQFSKDPLLTTNQYSLLSDLLAKCGGSNIFAEEKNAWPLVNKESIIKASPDLVMAVSNDKRIFGKLVDNKAAFYVLNDNEYKKEYLSLIGYHAPALDSIELIVLHPDIFSRETPRVVKHFRLLCDYLQTSVKE